MRGFDLSGCDLRKAILAGADLRSANLTGSDLRNADLCGADLSGANLSNANFRGANIRETQFAGAVTDGTRFDQPPCNVGQTTTFSLDGSTPGILTETGGDAPSAGSQLREIRFTMYRPLHLEFEQSCKLIIVGHSCFDMNHVRRVYEAEFADTETSVREVTGESPCSLDPNSSVTLVPAAPGVAFIPERQTIALDQDLAIGRFQVHSNVRVDQDTVVSGQVDIYLGKLVISSLPLAFEILCGKDQTGKPNSINCDWSGPYRRIFLSYSRRDDEIVQQCERFGATMGDDFLRDVTSLRSGEKWQERLEQLIFKAHVFQLFWSSNAMNSPHVHREYEYALSLNREKFIRPTYWEKPFPEDRDNGKPPQSLLDLNFHYLGGL